MAACLCLHFALTDLAMCAAAASLLASNISAPSRCASCTASARPPAAASLRTAAVTGGCSPWPPMVRHLDMASVSTCDLAVVVMSTNSS